MESFPRLESARSPFIQPTEEIRWGAFEGGVNRVPQPTPPSGIRRLIREVTQRKRWSYVCITDARYFFSAAWVDLGYAANCFVYLLDWKSGKVVFDQSRMGLPTLNLEVNDRPGIETRARFSKSHKQLSLSRGTEHTPYQLRGRWGTELEIDAELGPAPGPALSVIAQPRPPLFHFTQKTHLLPVSGTLKIAGQKWDWNQARAGIDYTYGYPPYQTEWRWGFGFAKTPEGVPVGFNLAEGNHLGAQRENAIWIGKDLWRLPEVEFRSEPRWSARSSDGQVDLRFEPAGEHREDRNYGLVRSHFVQVAGWYSGRLPNPKAPDQPWHLDRMQGVAENQRVKW